ncbi:MAG TPA: ABC transporter ATP-binding protein [Gammaproteobacteria bacterium]|nr:ABC transporter ATP-binding protein [Gammaproteobacteria bacterium]
MIELEDIHRDFRVGDQTVHALDGIDLRIDTGEYVSVMGPSGSGKSTLLNLLGLLDRASRGRYRLDGRDVTSLDENEQARVRNRLIGFVFQAFHLVPRLSAEQNVELPLILAGVPPGERRQRVKQALAGLALENRARHRPDQLSGGQRQRVAIARATVMRPRLLLADEPTGNLDHKSGLDVMNILEGLNAEGITLVLVTHDAQLGGRAPRRIHMLDGRIEQDHGDG